MKLIRKWLRNRRLRQQIAPRQRELERELQQSIDPALRLSFRSSKGGYDVTVLAQRQGQPYGILRINPPQPKVATRTHPGIKRALSPSDRIEREWTVYQQLAEHGLAPHPLWRTADAQMCSWVNWPRAAWVLRTANERVWPMLEQIVRGVQQMHALGLVHLDLNSGNVLLQPDGDGVCFIDFEYTAVPGTSLGEQRAYDWWRLILCLARRRRAGRFQRQEPDRFGRIFTPAAVEISQATDLKFLMENFPDLPHAVARDWWNWAVHLGKCAVRDAA